ncbi:MAG: hypothetical protein OXN19_02225, partial [Caldilineaceae bacterium]|nr:hypothetical protein [Caldilineaceae bacterium]
MKSTPSTVLHQLLYSGHWNPFHAGETDRPTESEEKMTQTVLESVQIHWQDLRGRTYDLMD